MRKRRLHDLTHRVPGVPAHDDQTVQERHQRRGPHPRARLANPTQHHERSPRVLVRWQNWIARLFRAER